MLNGVILDKGFATTTETSPDGNAATLLGVTFTSKMVYLCTHTEHASSSKKIIVCFLRQAAVYATRNIFSHP